MTTLAPAPTRHLTSTVSVHTLLLGEVEVDHSFVGARILVQRRELQHAAAPLFPAVGSRRAARRRPGALRRRARRPHRWPYAGPPDRLRRHWVELEPAMAALRRIVADSEGIVLPMYDRSVHERYAEGLS